MEKELNRSQIAALKAYPSDIYSGGNSLRRAYKEGYEQAEKNLTLTWQDVSILITIYEAGIDNGDYRRYNDAEWMKEYSQDILKRFNELKKK